MIDASYFALLGSAPAYLDNLHICMFEMMTDAIGTPAGFRRARGNLGPTSVLVLSPNILEGRV